MADPQSSTLLGPVLAATTSASYRQNMPLGQRGPKAAPTGGVPFSIQDFADFFPPPKVGPGSDSYDSTITDFEAERVAAEISLVDEASWDGLVRFVEGREVEHCRSTHPTSYSFLHPTPSYILPLPTSYMPMDL